MTDITKMTDAEFDAYLESIGNGGENPAGDILASNARTALGDDPSLDEEEEEAEEPTKVDFAAMSDEQFLRFLAAMDGQSYYQEQADRQRAGLASANAPAPGSDYSKMSDEQFAKLLDEV